jgi:hypothetical protein
MASAAATAATEAVMRATHPAPAPAAEVKVADGLADDDRRDYEIAQHLAESDPRYKDAPKIILDHIARAEDYASRWESANPGKEFNSSDPEHDEFFSALQRPWSTNDFRQAEINMAVKQAKAEVRAESDHSLAQVREDQARLELAPAVDRTFAESTGALAKMIGDNVHKALTTSGWDGLTKEDPVTAQVMATTLDQLHPFIQAAVEIDDPRQRVRIDAKGNQAHAQWNRVVTVGEQRLTGQRLDDGRVFARRADYVRMTPTQQAAHWYLTTEMIIEGAIEYAADQVKKVSEAQKDKLKRLGFVRQTSPQAAASAE